jgi:hypothetical protein
MSDLSSLNQIVTLTYEHNSDFIHFKTDCSGRTYDEMMQFFINFLRGIGYIVPDEEDRV